MRFPFALRIGLAIGLLTVGSTGAVTALIYFTVSDDTWEQMRSHARGLAHTGSYMFTPSHRRIIQNLDGILIREGTRPIPELDAGDTAQSLPENRVSDLQRSDDFHTLAQLLRRIKLGSSDEARPDGFLAQRVSESAPPRIRFAYILAPFPGSPDFKLVRFTADGDYEELDEDGNGLIEEAEQATTIGEVYSVAPQDGLRNAMKGVPSANSAYTEDKWGVWISGFSPILDEKGNVIAVLGVDYAAAGEFNRLRRLRNFCFVILFSSLLLSAAAAVIVSRWFTKPMMGLRAGADEVSKGNTHVQVQMGSRARDELTDLAESFNSMVAQVRASLEDQKEAITALVKTAKLRDEFLSNFSHELNTPIASVMASLELLKDGTYTQEELSAAASDMLIDVMRLHSLVSNMLMVSKLESNTLEAVRGRTDAAQVLKAARMRTENPEFLQVSAPSSLEILTDAQLLEKILLEIFKNALLHGQASAVKPAQVRLEKTPGGCTISVFDNGPGVPEAHLPRLGEKYFRVDSSLTYARRGTGLGLHLAVLLAQKLGGSLFFENQSTGGFVCRLVLPLNAA